MPLPKMPEKLRRLVRNGCGLGGPTYNESVYSDDRQTCFDAGKKEIRDNWPPPDKKQYCYHGMGQTEVVYYDHKTEYWMQLENFDTQEFRKSRHQMWLIGQWLNGKLEEVKEETSDESH